MSAAKQQLLAELCEKQKCDVFCVQETHRGLKAIRPNIRGMSLVAEIPHEQYGRAIFVRNNCICDSTSTSNTNSVEIIQAQLNKLTVTSVYKPPNEQFSYRPISRLCHTYKLFERMILNRLNPLIETMIIDQQAGFRPGKSTTGQLLNLTQHIEDGYNNNNK